MTGSFRETPSVVKHGRLMLAIGLAILAHTKASGDEMVELIKDIQATSRMRTSCGQCEVKIVFYKITLSGFDRTDRVRGKVLALDEPTQINASIRWKGDSSLIKYDARGPGQVIIGYHPHANGGRDEIVMNKTYAMRYTDNTAVLQVYDRTRWSPSSLLNLNPTLFWYSCCPPIEAKGRTWIEMLDLQPPASSGLTVRYETDLAGNSTIVRTRIDSDGGRLVVVYDMELGANVIKQTYDKGPLHDELSYRWKRIGDRIFVPETIELVKLNQNKIQEKFEYTFSNIVLRGDETDADFTLDGFLLAKADKKVSVIDHRSGKRYAVGGFRGIGEKTLDELIEKASLSGFSARPK